MPPVKPNPHCKGCIHCGSMGAMWGFIYIFNKGHSRPCDPGKDCTVKETRKRKRGNNNV